MVIAIGNDYISIGYVTNQIFNIMNHLRLLRAAKNHYGNECELKNFREHSTHHAQRWGRVELLPLIRWAQPSCIEIPTQLRNPLRQPRKVKEDERYREEGRLVANKISALIGETIDDDGAPG